MLSEKNILITGGAGSLGKEIVREIFNRYPKVKKVVVFSRDELKHHQMSWEFSPEKYPIEYIIGNIRDSDRLLQAMEGMDVVIHAAALKQVTTCEMNPEECYKTNVSGTQNVIKAAKYLKVPQVLLISTDKAVDPASVYGNSKQAAEKLVIKANDKKLICGVIRLGNLVGSTGSVVPYFFKLRSTGVVPVTDPKMTRFGGTIKDGAIASLNALEKIQGGEIFAPKWDSFSVGDLAKVIAPNCKQELIGLRKHEKMHEALISSVEIPRLIENEEFLIITKEIIENDEAIDYYSGLKTISSNSLKSNTCIRLSNHSLSEMINTVIEEPSLHQ